MDGSCLESEGIEERGASETESKDIENSSGRIFVFGYMSSCAKKTLSIEFLHPLALSSFTDKSKRHIDLHPSTIFSAHCQYYSPRTPAGAAPAA
jgi:hypothetical protein